MEIVQKPLILSYHSWNKRVVRLCQLDLQRIRWWDQASCFEIAFVEMFFKCGSNHHLQLKRTKYVDLYFFGTDSLQTMPRNSSAPSGIVRNQLFHLPVFPLLEQSRIIRSSTSSLYCLASMQYMMQKMHISSWFENKLQLKLWTV